MDNLEFNEILKLVIFITNDPSFIIADINYYIKIIKEF